MSRLWFRFFRAARTARSNQLLAINSQLSTRSSLRELLNHFLKLRAEHIHLSAHQIAAQRDACHAEVARVRNEGG